MAIKTFTFPNTQFYGNFSFEFPVKPFKYCLIDSDYKINASFKFYEKERTENFLIVHTGEVVDISNFNILKIEKFIFDNVSPPAGNLYIIFSENYKVPTTNIKQANSIETGISSVTSTRSQILNTTYREIKIIVLKNTGNNTCYIGNDSVTTTNGFSLKPNETLTLDNVSTNIYAICESTQTTTISVMILYYKYN